MLRFELWIGAGVAFIAALFGIYKKGRKDERSEDYIETRKRMDDADITSDGADRLHKRKSKRNL